MRSAKQFLFLIFLLISLNVISQNCIIGGVSSDYAGVQSPVYTIDNPVTGSRSIIDTISFNKKGSFQISLDLSERTVLYFDLGRYEGFLYARPGFRYELYLPPYIRKTHYNNINPYYKAVEAHLKVSEYQNIENKTVLDIQGECNHMLFRFDTLFSKANEEILLNRQENSYIDVDSLMSSIERNFALDSSDFFRRYRKFRYGLLNVNGGKMGLKDLTINYLNERIPRLNEPAYMDLFNVMYDDFFMYYSRTEKGKSLGTSIDRKQSLYELRQTLRKHKAIFSDTIADLVILKEISQHYYKNYFIKDALLIILDSLSSNGTMSEYRLIAQEMYNQYSSLRIGNPPPEVSLRDQDGNYTSLKQFRGKYVYMYFCTPDNYSCMTEYPFLESFHRKHKEYLEILTIMVAEKMEDMIQFMDQNNYEWKAVFYKDQADILKTYNVKYYPTAFLIDPDGKLVQSPATLPSEGFEQQLFRIMRSKGEI